MVATNGNDLVSAASQAASLLGLDWNKMDGLMPAVIQHAFDGRVLMQAFMNKEALEATCSTDLVTFWSRSRQELWTKGETSGNQLQLVRMIADCDNDCLLVQVIPTGPVCHLGTASCFDQSGDSAPDLAFLAALERLIEQRQADRPDGSYTTGLFEAGIKRIAQKVGEEGVETALAATAGDEEETLSEAADLIYHLLVLLRAKGVSLSQLVERLKSRHVQGLPTRPTPDSSLPPQP